MAGLLSPMQEEATSLKSEDNQRTKPREEDLFTRTIVAGGQQALFNEQLGPQIVQLAHAGQDPANGVGVALTVLLSNMRNSLVEQGKGVPMDLLFIPQGAAEILAQDIAEMAGAPPEAAQAAVGIAQQMIMQTEEAAKAGQQGGGMPPEAAGGSTAPPMPGQRPTAPAQPNGATGAPMGLLAGGV